MNKEHLREQYEAHIRDIEALARIEFEKQWLEGEEWRNGPESGMRGNEKEIAFLKDLLWPDFLRTEIEGSDQNWINRPDRPQWSIDWSRLLGREPTPEPPTPPNLGDGR